MIRPGGILSPVIEPVIESLTSAITAALGGLPSTPFTPLVTVACGNSIAVQSKWLGSFWGWGGELHVANLFAGGAMRFKRITPTTRSDLNGIYGYSGQTLETINSDIQAQRIDPINAAGVTPELVVGLALAENDIVSSATAAQIHARIDTWVTKIQTTWPSAKILLVTPRPSFSNNTEALVAKYQSVRDYTLSLENGATILVARGDTYENPAAPGTPLSSYTDVSVHPNAKGAMVNARAIARKLRRLGVASFSDSVLATNRTLTGSVATSGTNLTGTRPTGTSFPGSANGTFVTEALNPGWRVTFNNNTATANLDIGTFQLPTEAIAGAPTYISPYLKVRIVSGAENLRAIELWPRILDGGGNTFQYHIQQQTLDAEPDFQNGDVLTFVCPPKAANSGSITQLINYIRPKMKTTTGATTVEILDHGYMVVT